MRYFEREFEENTFSSLVVDVTHKCNMKCANCYIPNRSIPDLDLPTLRKNLERLPRKTWIRLIGAEPTMRDDLADVIRAVIETGHRPSVTTNGLRLADETFLAGLHAAGLRYVYISLNGAEDDEAYRKIDNGRYADLKRRALKNLFALRIHVAAGCIIASGINENVIGELPRMLARTAQESGVKFTSRYFPTIRYKSVGAIGRYMQGRSYSFIELKALIASRLGLGEENFVPCAAGSNTPVIFGKYQCGRWKGDEREESFVAMLDSENGPISVRLVNWDVDADGVVNAGNENRGRVTADWKIAPFFEHVKLNEFGY